MWMSISASRDKTAMSEGLNCLIKESRSQRRIRSAEDRYVRSPVEELEHENEGAACRSACVTPLCYSVKKTEPKTREGLGLWTSVLWPLVIVRGTMTVTWPSSLRLEPAVCYPRERNSYQALAPFALDLEAILCPSRQQLAADAPGLIARRSIGSMFFGAAHDVTLEGPSDARLDEQRQAGIDSTGPIYDEQLIEQILPGDEER